VEMLYVRGSSRANNAYTAPNGNAATEDISPETTLATPEANAIRSVVCNPWRKHRSAMLMYPRNYSANPARQAAL
jgi:hypothetical protein